MAAPPSHTTEVLILAEEEGCYDWKLIQILKTSHIQTIAVSQSLMAFSWKSSKISAQIMLSKGDGTPITGFWFRGRKSIRSSIAPVGRPGRAAGAWWTPGPVMAVAGQSRRTYSPGPLTLGVSLRPRRDNRGNFTPMGVGARGRQ